MKEKYRKELVETKEKAADDAKDEAVIRMAVENAEIVELPHVMVHDEVHRSMDEFLNNMQRQGISPENVLSINCLQKKTCINNLKVK